MAEEKLLSLQEVAKQLGVHEITIRRMAWTRKLPCIVINRLYRFRQSDIDNYIKQHSTEQIDGY